VAAFTASLFSIPLELYSLDQHLTLYCDNILGTVSTLRQFTTLALSQSLLRLQIFKEYLSQEYPIQQCVCCLA